MLGLCLLVLLVAVPLFARLGSLPVVLWDESRLALNALSMYQTGDLLVTRYAGEPDHWNTKPPMMIWLQVLGMHALGPGEWALRLPSAIAGLLTCLGVAYAGARYTGRAGIGVLAALVLVTSWGYVAVHATRTGDYDALLALFTTGAALAFLGYCELRRERYLAGFFLFMLLALLTKGVAALLILPGLLAYAALSGSLRPLLHHPLTYAGTLAVVAFVLGYYALREMHDPGYVAAVLYNELLGRFGEPMEGHAGDPLTYLKVMLKGDYLYWMPFLGLGLWVGLRSRETRIRRLTWFALLVLAGHFAVISISDTKLPWYLVPAYPLMAVIAAVGIHWAFSCLTHRPWRASMPLARGLIPHAFLAALLVPAYGLILHKTLDPEPKLYSEQGPDFYDLSNYLRAGLSGQRDLDGARLVDDDCNAHQEVYVELLRLRGQDVAEVPLSGLTPGDLVLTARHEVRDRLHAAFELREVDRGGNVRALELIARRPPPPEGNLVFEAPPETPPARLRGPAPIPGKAPPTGG